jgi:hypothetical protein
MCKKTIYALIVSLVTTLAVPSIGMCRPAGYHGSPGRYHSGYHRAPGRYYGGHHGSSHHNDAWVWGLGGLVVGSVLAAAFLQYPPPPQAVYGYPPAPTKIYSYKPSIPPGMCRWERTVLDYYGRPVLDQNGRPVMEYTIGSCQSPPN